MKKTGLILKIDCPDQSGIVAKLASYASLHGGNLTEFSQFTDSRGGRFFARLEIDTASLDVEEDDFIAGFGTLGRGLDARWHFRKLPYRMRTAVMVTATDHCLNEVLWRTQLGELPVEITSRWTRSVDSWLSARKGAKSIEPIFKGPSRKPSWVEEI